MTFNLKKNAASNLVLCVKPSTACVFVLSRFMTFARCDFIKLPTSSDYPTGEKWIYITYEGKSATFDPP